MKHNYKVLRRLEKRIKAELKERFGRTIILDGAVTNYNHSHQFFCYRCMSGFAAEPRYLISRKYGCPNCKQKKIDQAVLMRKLGTTFNIIAEALEVTEATARRWAKTVI